MVLELFYKNVPKTYN